MKLTPAMMRTLARIDSRLLSPREVAANTLDALERRGLVERFSPEVLDGQPSFFAGTHPDRLRVTEAGRRYATLARLGLKETGRRRS